MRTENQKRASARNHEILRLRGMFWTARKLITDDVRRNIILCAINEELEARGATPEGKQTP